MCFTAVEVAAQGGTCLFELLAEEEGIYMGYSRSNIVHVAHDVGLPAMSVVTFVIVVVADEGAGCQFGVDGG